MTVLTPVDAAESEAPGRRPVRVLRELHPEAAVEFLRNELGRRLVQVAGRCSIDYQGRAASQLPSGNRLLLFKPDGTLLVHGARKLKPVNWQPPGCTFSAAREGGQVVLTACREKPKETVRIVLEEVQLVVSMSLDDADDLDLQGSEDDLQAFLSLRPQLVEPGFRFWSRERASGRGPMDLYGEDAQGRRVVVEVKRRAAGVKEADQLRRYVERERAARGDIRCARCGEAVRPSAGGPIGTARCESCGDDVPVRHVGTPVRGILVAPVVSEKARKYLADLDLEYRELDWDKLRQGAADLLKAGQRTLGEW